MMMPEFCPAKLLNNNHRTDGMKETEDNDYMSKCAVKRVTKCAVIR